MILPVKANEGDKELDDLSIFAGNQLLNPARMHHLMVYGLQRSATNYLEQLVNRNFKIEQKNNGFARSLPVHKHFRLYDDMSFAPEPKYLNNFHHPSFASFDEDVKRLTGSEDLAYLVISKEPYSWYLSYYNEAKRNKWPYCVKNGVNSHFMVDYSLFYGKWLGFKDEAPNKVYMLRYEDLLTELEDTLERIRSHFGFEKLHAEYENPSKVPMSKKFTDEKKEYYQKRKYLDRFGEEELWLLRENLDKEVVKKLGYEL